jgi:hypothetical protein
MWLEGKNGPGWFDPKFELTERRLDVGIKEWRPDYVEKQEEFDEKELLKPAVDATGNYDLEAKKPNKLVFKYYDKTV